MLQQIKDLLCERERNRLKPLGRLFLLFFFKLFCLELMIKRKKLIAHCITDDTIVRPKSDIQAKYEHQK